MLIETQGIIPKILDDFEDLLSNLELNDHRPFLIGIDGRPCSGKSTLADKLTEVLKAEALFLDDFFIPQSDWPKTIVPAFPFPYLRFREFIDGVKTLAQGHSFHYREYDWDKRNFGAMKTINPESIVIVEGVSVLCDELMPYYTKKVLVLSNRNNELQAIAARESAENLVLWKNLYLPSVELYWQTKPWDRADILYAGRGITHKGTLEKFLFDQ